MRADGMSIPQQHKTMLGAYLLYQLFQLGVIGVPIIMQAILFFCLGQDSAFLIERLTIKGLLWVKPGGCLSWIKAAIVCGTIEINHITGIPRLDNAGSQLFGKGIQAAQMPISIIALQGDRI